MIIQKRNVIGRSAYDLTHSVKMKMDVCMVSTFNTLPKVAYKFQSLKFVYNTKFVGGMFTAPNGQTPKYIQMYTKTNFKWNVRIREGLQSRKPNTLTHKFDKMV